MSKLSSKSRFLVLLHAGSLLILLSVNSGLQAADLLIRNVTLVSPERATPLRQASVRIRNGTIEGVFNREVASEEGMPVLDGTDLYLIPGLMDSHLHSAVLPGLGFVGGQRANRFRRMTSLYEQQFGRSLLYHGVTQFIDPAAYPTLQERLHSQPLAPKMFFCGAVPLAHGYPAVFMDEAAVQKSLPYRIDQSTEQSVDTRHARPSRHQPEAIVKRIREEGAICLKLFFEDGWDASSEWPMLSDDLVQRLVQSAHASGMTVIGHANALDMQQMAVEAEVDVLGHGLWNWNQYRNHTALPAEIRQHLDRVRDSGIGYQPTLRVMYGMRELFMPGLLRNPALRKVVPPELLAWYRHPEAQDFKKELARVDFDNLPDERIAKLMGRTISQGERSLKYVAQSGHRLLLASDHPATPGHANHPGLSSYQELRHMSDLGIPLDKIFAAATINNPLIFGLADRYGSIEIGKVANLLLLESNPLETIEAYDSIRWVVLDGRKIPRASLAADR